MEWLAGLGFLGALLLLVRAHRRNVERAASRRDDMRRAGEHASPRDAALRATGTNAWMRPGGF